MEGAASLDNFEVQLVYRCTLTVDADSCVIAKDGKLVLKRCVRGEGFVLRKHFVGGAGVSAAFFRVRYAGRDMFRVGVEGGGCDGI